MRFDPCVGRVEEVIAQAEDELANGASRAPISEKHEPAAAISRNCLGGRRERSPA